MYGNLYLTLRNETKSNNFWSKRKLDDLFLNIKQMNKPKCLVFDLDWVLCELWDSSNPYNHDGEEYVITEMKYILESFASYEDEVIILTGRKRKDYWKITEKWLDDSDIYYDKLIMQEWSQGEKNHIYKEKELVKLQERYDIVAMVDDNPDLIPVCKKLGILLLQVHR